MGSIGSGTYPLRTLFFIKAVGSLFDQDSMSEKILNQGLRVIVGDGNRVNFWTDLYDAHVPLCRAFTRIFALAINKSGPVKGFGKWQGNRGCGIFHLKGLSLIGRKSN